VRAALRILIGCIEVQASIIRYGKTSHVVSGLFLVGARPGQLNLISDKERDFAAWLYPLIF
jgi:hypothetical protein